MELGVATFADLGAAGIAKQRMRELMEEAELADQLRLDVFAVGEHHRADFLVSSPATVLAAAAVRTERIRLSSAVTVLSSDDPVRVFQAFAHVHLLSGGRAEIMAGRGSFTESFPLFGYDLDDYDELFAEKLELLLAIREQTRVTWSGRHRTPLRDAGIYPRPVQDRWCAPARWDCRSRSRSSAASPSASWGWSSFYREAARRAGHDLAQAKVAINAHAFVGATSAQANAAFASPYLAGMNRIGRERGWPPMAREGYAALSSPRGALAVGSPEQVAEKILFEHELFANQRYIGQMSVGTVAHPDVLASMERFGTDVAPLVRTEIARREANAAPSGRAV